MYWISVYTFGALLQFQYHSCEEIVYFSWDYSTTFIQYIKHTEVTSGQQVLSRCFHCAFHCARLESMYWISVSTFGALLHFQYHSCEEIVYFSRDFSTTFIQYIKHTEVTSGQQVLSRCFHCARLESMYWISVSTFGALLHFQYHSCEEIVYFSRDYWNSVLLLFNTSNSYRSHIGATGVIAMLSLCSTWIEVLKFSLHLWGTSSVSEPQLWRDSLLFKGL